MARSRVVGAPLPPRHLIGFWRSRESHERYQQGVAESGGWGHILEHLKTEPESVDYADF